MISRAINRLRGLSAKQPAVAVTADPDVPLEETVSVRIVCRQCLPPLGKPTAAGYRSKYRMEAFPVGELSKTATKAYFRAPVAGENATDARRNARELLAQCYPPGGTWRILLTKEGRWLKPMNVNLNS